MYGSDWPVCLLSASYESQIDVITKYLSQLSTIQTEAVMGGNAIRFYNLE